MFTSNDDLLIIEDIFVYCPCEIFDEHSRAWSKSNLIRRHRIDKRSSLLRTLSDTISTFHGNTAVGT